MRLIPLCLVVVSTAVPTLRAQSYQKEPPVSFAVDGFYRKEWTKDLFNGDDQERWRIQVRPRLELSAGAFKLGVGGDFNYADTDNTEPPEGETSIRLQRDNFASRDARLDLAFARFDPGPWLRLEGGRFVMPVVLTEMIWDQDLRTQGASARLALDVGLSRLTATGLWSKESHVFDDSGVQTFLASGAFEASAFDLTASFVRFTELERLDSSLIRQNSRGPDGRLRHDRFEVLDFVLRLHREGGVSVQIVANYAWNTAADDENRGFWGRLRLGSMDLGRGALEYTYANLDRDVTLAAYATDDFIWSTGWEGHRGELEVKTTDNSSIAVSAQVQRFKISPRPEERDHWVKRYRLDLRIDY